MPARQPTIKLIQDVLAGSISNQSVTNVTAGMVSSSGQVTIYPSSANGGYLRIINANTGAYTGTVSLAALGQNSTYTIPDAGATGSFVMTTGSQTISGTKTFSVQLVSSATSNHLKVNAGGTSYTMTFTTASAGQNSTVSFPDPGSTSTANIDYINVAQTISAAKTFTTQPRLMTAGTNVCILHAVAQSGDNTLNIPDLGAAVSGYVLVSNVDNTLDDGVDFALGTTNGTKIGTAASQKLAFWNASPVVQPSGSAQANCTFAAGTPATNNALVTVVADGSNTAAASVDNNFATVATILSKIRTDLVAAGIWKGSA